jgi:hypothetical protein
MAMPQRNARAAQAGSDLPAAPLALLKKGHTANNIVVGSDPAQVRFLGQFFATEPTAIDRVTDDSLLGHSGLLLQILYSHQIDLSPEVRAKTNIWSAEPIKKGSAAASAMVKYAHQLLGATDPLKRELVDRVSDLLTKDEIDDILAAVWQAVWLLSAEIPEFRHWKQPWEGAVQWLEADVDPQLRLNCLYKDLVGYTYVAFDEKEGARKFGVRPSQAARFAQWRLDVNKVYRTIRELSVWRTSKRDPYVCALRVAAIWS